MDVIREDAGGGEGIDEVAGKYDVAIYTVYRVAEEGGGGRGRCSEGQAEERWWGS